MEIIDTDPMEFIDELNKLIKLSIKYDRVLPDLFNMEDPTYRNLLNKNLPKYLEILKLVYDHEEAMRDMRTAESDMNQSRIEAECLEESYLELMGF